jgi:hypothetical protein
MVLVHVSESDIAAQSRIAAAMVNHAGALLRPGFRVETCAYVSSRLQGATRRLYSAAARLYTRGRPLRIAAALLLLLPTLGLALIDNLSRGPGRRVRGQCSAVSVVLRKA